MPKRDSDLDAEIERKLWADIRKVEQDATKNVAAMVSCERLWEERTVGDVVSLDVYRGAVGLRKAREAAQSVTNNIGVIMMPARIESGAQWEAASKEIEEGKKVFEIAELPQEEPEPAA